VAIVDVIDYLILRALAHFQRQAAPTRPEGPSDEEFAGLSSQDRYDRAMDYYLSEQCSTGRLAELLQILGFDLREHLIVWACRSSWVKHHCRSNRKTLKNARKWAEQRDKTK